jgi:NitT/TauT family transport system substrate-binding protein
MNLTRREFVSGLTLAGTAGLSGVRPQTVAAEPPPETTRLRLARTTSVCHAPQYVAEALLVGEGFTDVQYRTDAYGGVEAKALAAGEIDLTLTFVGPLLLRIDENDPVVLLAGGHVGCLELFGTDRIKTVRDLKGKRIAVYSLQSAPHVFLAMILAQVGLDHRRDVTLITSPPPEAMRAFSDGTVDALIASPPVAQELRARRIGHVVANSTADRPWSQYFCCMIAGNGEFVRKRPVAVKRAVRAVLKAADMCGLAPDRVARSLVERGFTKQYDYALQALKDIPYGKWREYDPEDTVRFYALRMHEVGMIKSTPQKLIAQGADWRILNELRTELKR